MFMWIHRHAQVLIGVLCATMVLVLITVTWDMGKRVALTPAQMIEGIEICQTDIRLRVAHNGTRFSPPSKIWCTLS